MLFKNEAGEILYSEGAHTARAGWNNIYLGENGEILQIAGSSYNFDEERISHDEETVDQWMEQMNTYLEHSHSLLSTQDGVVRTQ